MTPNRVVALGAAACSLILAVLPAVAGMDWTSAAGVLAGIPAVALLASKWLDGWQAHEARQAPVAAVEADSPPDDDLAASEGVLDVQPDDPTKIPADKGDSDVARRDA